MSLDKEKNYSNFIQSAAFSNIIKSLSKPEFFSKYCNSNIQITPSNLNSNQKIYSHEDIKNISENLSADLKSDQKLNIAFISFYGSRNYGLANSESDYDFFIVYYPSFGNFFNHKFIRHSVIKENYDYFITPFHEYMHHVINGNIKFIEPLICDSIYFPVASQSPHFALSNLVEETKKFILLNYKKNFDSFIGLANNKRLNITKDNYTSNTLIYKDIYGYDIKEAMNALRILYLVQNYLTTGKIDFFVKNNADYIEFEKICADIKNKIISKEDILQLLDSMIKNINYKIIKFIDNDDDNNKKFYSVESESINKSNYNYDLRKDELEADIKKSVENICKNNLD
jgi:predicted nucleotidyltransferase